MNSVEMMTYRMNLKNGTLEQIAEALESIAKLEDEVPDELMGEIVEVLLTQHERAKFTYSVIDILCKTRSEKLYLVADQLGYIKGFGERFHRNKYLNPRIALLVEKRFYRPELEEQAIAELFKLFTYLDHLNWEHYRVDLDLGNSPGYDSVIKSVTSPSGTMHSILNTLAEISSPTGRESLRALDLHFRPRLNDYMVAEQRRLAQGNPAALVPPPSEDESDGSHIVYWMGQENVYQLRNLINKLRYIMSARTADDNTSGDGVCADK